MQDNSIYKNLKYNYVYNLLDGGFFGLGLGFASFSTILPLFVSTMTDSAVLIGLIPAIHNMGWQLPQLFSAQRIARQPRFRTLVLLMTIQERAPYIGLALVAAFLPVLGKQAALVITFILLIWQGLGAGLTANAWQNMISRIIPPESLTTFFGFQSAAANLLASVGAITAGYILEKNESPLDFTLCFSLACASYIISYFFLSRTREPERIPSEVVTTNSDFWQAVWSTLRGDHNFRSFLASRMLAQFGMMAFAFYTVYAVRHHHISEATAGIMTSLLMITQVASNPLFGWISDHWSRKKVLEVGALTTMLSVLLAWQAPNIAVFYIAVVLYGLSNSIYWTVGMSLNLQFGTEDERPTYVGLANTLLAPATILAPLLGGWLADTAGYPTMFVTSAVFAGITGVLLHFFVADPLSPQPVTRVVVQ